ncbi:C-C chemokine receptor type 8-like isoform X2 [Mytilus trossulus]|uniref:C-C chemokine receptor type 8-like isoform X2 n=1 Tax=Mytilus trossulus TaxID=6551 RepID=UPI003004FFB3
MCVELKQHVLISSTVVATFSILIVSINLAEMDSLPSNSSFFNMSHINSSGVPYKIEISETSTSVVGTADTGNSTNVFDRQDFCTTPYCIPNAIIISLISISGIVMNLVVIVIVKIDKRLHQPTFVAIACLALPDFTFLFSRYIRYIIDGYIWMNISKSDYRKIKITLDFIGLVAAGSSVFHVVFMSVLRYFIIVHPLKSRSILTSKKVMLISLPLWIVAVGNGSFYMYAVIFNLDDRKLAFYTNLAVTIFMTAFPIVTISILHTFKAKALLNSLSSTEMVVRKMSRVVTFVICCYLITTTPTNVMDIIRLFHPKYFMSKVLFRLEQAARIFFFLTYAINPFIYFIFSPQFKRFFKEKCSKTRMKFSRSPQSQTMSTTIHSHSTQLTETGSSVQDYNAIKTLHTQTDK